MAKELRVLVADDQIGSVFQKETGKLAFVYDDDWRTRIDNYPLSLSMPLTQREHTGSAVAN
jgi:HipA-like protein